MPLIDPEPFLVRLTHSGLILRVYSGPEGIRAECDLGRITRAPGCRVLLGVTGEPARVFNTWIAALNALDRIAAERQR